MTRFSSRSRRSGERRIFLAVTHEVSARAFYRGFATFLQSKGWETTVVTGSQGSLEEFGKEEGTAVWNIPMRREPSPKADLVSLARWVRLLRRERPDVVVAGTPKAGLLGMLSARITGVPTRIYHMRGLRLETATGVRRMVFRALERLTVASSTLVMANSSSLIDVMRAEGILGHTPAQVPGRGSSQGVDLDRFRPGALAEPLPDADSRFWDAHTGALRALAVGRLHVDKGLDVLVEALGMCVDAGVPVACMVVGDTEDPALLDRLRAASKRLPLRVSGGIRDPRAHFAAAEVLCHPSRREGFPNVVLEAAAMAVPAIVTDSTGTVDSVVDGRTGLVVPTDDAAALATALARVARDRQLLRELGDGARRHVEDHYRRPDVWANQERLFAVAMPSTPL